MKQVTQTLRTGIVEVNEGPIPTLNDKFVLVINTASVITAGTEKTKIDMGKKILFLIQMPPPVHGAAVMNKTMFEVISENSNYDVSLLKLNYAINFSNSLRDSFDD